MKFVPTGSWSPSNIKNRRMHKQLRLARQWRSVNLTSILTIRLRRQMRSDSRSTHENRE